MKNSLLLLFFIPFFLFSQKKKSNKIGQVKEEELKMKNYNKDSLANAVVLYEHANVYLDEKNSYDFRTDYYFRIKIFNKKAFDKGNIIIPLYNKEKAIDVKAVTYNLDGTFIRKSFLKKDQIFTTQKNKNWKEVRFTLPNMQEGSVIEFVYSVISPYSRLDDWYFQSDIPKIKSEYDAAILGNYKYNTRLIGFQKLNKNNPSIKKRCINIDGLGDGACAIYSYGMNNIPAFKEEDYMLHKKNFMSRLALDLISFTEVNGTIRKYTKTWKDADKTLKLKYLDGQTSKKNYFKKNIPQSILGEENELKRAKNVYTFIQQKLNWNDRYWTSEKLKVKKVFEEGTGSVDAINLILYNSLQAAGIESYIVASSTRNNGLPTKLYPMVNDFNYILVKAIIEGKTYFLDATDKNLAFGQIPFKCINGDGRILDFKKGSYWETIYPKLNSSINNRISLKLGTDNNLIGSLQVVRKGYYALSERQDINAQSQEDYLDSFETTNPIFLVEDYSVNNLKDKEKSLRQLFKIQIENDSQDSKILNINPFLLDKVAQNPFKLKERSYPVDYGYTRNHTYLLKLEIPKEYKILKIPENRAFSLPNKGGSFILKVNQINNQINIYAKRILSRKVYSSEEYHYLKEFFNQIIETEKSNIKIEKI